MGKQENKGQTTITLYSTIKCAGRHEPVIFPVPGLFAAMSLGADCVTAIGLLNPKEHKIPTPVVQMLFTYIRDPYK